MLGLRRWHKNLLLSEVLATIVVIWGYRAVIAAGTAPSFGERFAAGLWTILLAPGWWLLGKPGDGSLAAVCLLTAAVYTAVFFAILSLMTFIVGRLRAIVSIKGRQQPDLARYLR